LTKEGLCTNRSRARVGRPACETLLEAAIAAIVALLQKGHASLCASHARGVFTLSFGLPCRPTSGTAL
jgi:hypothetical protein